MDFKTILPNTWNMWYHYDKDNWKLSGYKDIYKINTVGDFWKFYNNLDKFKGIYTKHLFLMKDKITPLWEDPENINGGCWSFKVTDVQAINLWYHLSVNLVCGQLLNEVDGDECIGISICLKKNNFTVIKIWNKLSKNNSLLLINKNIIKQFGCDVIYIAHMPEK